MCGPCSVSVSPSRLITGPVLFTRLLVSGLQPLYCLPSQAASSARSGSDHSLSVHSGSTHSSSLDEHLESSYRLPIWDASADILADINDRISSTTTGIWLKKVSNLLPNPDVLSWRFYPFEGEVIKFRSLSRHVTELAGMHSFENLVKMDANLSSSKAEDIEASVRPIIEASSWMD